MPTFLTTLLRLLWRLWQRLTLQPLTEPPAIRPPMSNPPTPHLPSDSVPPAQEMPAPPASQTAIHAAESPEATAIDAPPQEMDTPPREMDAVGGDDAVVAAEDEAAPPKSIVDEAATSTNGTTPPATLPAAAPIPAPAIPAPLVATEAGNVPLTSVLESLLFVAEAPVAAAQIAPLLDLPVEQVEAGLRQLSEHYLDAGRGLRLQQRDGEYALVSAPATASLIERFLSLDLTTKLSGPALETLAIVAYRQPVTRAQVEAVRGVDCSGMLRSLVQRGLVEELGQVDAVGRPYLYGVTDFFMNHFGLTEMGELPPLAAEDADALQAALSLGQ